MKQKTFTATIQVIPDKFGETAVTVVGETYAVVEEKINKHYQDKAGVTSWEILNIALEKDNEVIV